MKAVRIEIPDEERTAPMLSLIGPIPLVTPAGVDRLHPKTQERVEEVERLVGVGKDVEAARLALAIEADLGITADDRIEAMAAVEPWEIDLERALGLAAATANGQTLVLKPTHRPVKVELPEQERGVGVYHISHFDSLTRKAMRERDPKLQQEILDKRTDWEGLPRRRREERAVAEGIAESVALAQSRNETVVDEGEHLRITDRDGLFDLYENRKIDTDEYEVLLRYRRCIEAQSPLGSATIADTGLGAHDNDEFVKRWVSRSKKATVACEIERKVALKSIPHPSALQMLRWVAGQRGNLTAFGKGRAYTRNLVALKAAAEVAADVFRLHDKTPQP